MTGNENSDHLKRAIESEGRMREALSTILRETFYNDDLSVVKNNLDNYLLCHDSLHDTMSRLNQHVDTAASILRSWDEDLTQEDLDIARTQLHVLKTVHVAVEYFELTVLDHIHHLEGRDEFADVKPEDIFGAPAPDEKRDYGWDVEAMMRAYSKIAEPTQFEQQAYLEILRLADVKRGQA